MGLNLSNQRIAQELGLNKDDVQQMTTQLRQGIVDQKEPVALQGEAAGVASGGEAPAVVASVDVAGVTPA